MPVRRDTEDLAAVVVEVEVTRRPVDRGPDGPVEGAEGVQVDEEGQEGPLVAVLLGA